MLTVCDVMTRKPLSRPTLLPGLARLWRDPHTLQIGLDPARAVLLDLPDRSWARLLDLLTGDQPERAVLTHARRLGMSQEDARTLLDALRTAGLVVGRHTLLPQHLTATARERLSGEAVALALQSSGPPVAGGRPDRDGPGGGRPSPARVLRRRAAARVTVSGWGRLAAGIAVGLAQAGVGHVHADVPGLVTAAELAGSPLTEADVGRPRRAAIADRVTRAAPAAATSPVRRGGADLLIQLGHDQPVALLAAGHRYRRQPHLAVAVREGTVVLGPFVPATGSPCLNCRDLHRLDRDSAWPRLHAQLDRDAPEACGVGTVLVATGHAVAEALAVIDGGAPETIGSAVEIAAPGRIRRRTWPPHPACDCGRSAANRRPGRSADGRSQ